MEEVKLSKHHIKYEIKDNKSQVTLLFIHGFNSSSFFCQNLYKLKNNYNLISLNLPGNKEYAPLKEELSIDEMSEVIFEFIETKIRGQIVVVGHSLGGAIITHLPESKKIKKYIFLASLHPYIVRNKIFKLLNLVTKNQLFNIAFEKLKNFYDDQKLKNFLNPTPGFKKMYFENILNYEYLTKKLLMNYQKIQKPIMSIVGSEDNIIGTKHFEEFMLEKLKIKTSVIENADHNPIFYEKGNKINNIFNKLFPFKRRFFPFRIIKK